MKYSIIVPVYNTEKYIKKCLNSLINQTFDNYEIIIVNDGSTDKSLDIIKEYSKKHKNIKIYNKDNSGPSDSRNLGIEKATGNYFIFVDSDDYIDIDLLKKVDNIINEDKPDVVKFSFTFIKDKNRNDVLDTIQVRNKSGQQIFIDLVESKNLFDSPCIFAYSKDYWVKNKFFFAPNKFHEDFGIIPLVVLKAKKISFINEVLYYYIQRENSIMTSSIQEKLNRKAMDMLYHYDFLKSQAENIKFEKIDTKKYFYSYISNGVILKAKTLRGKEYNKYIDELKKRKVFNNLLENNSKRKIKKILMSVAPKIFVKVI